MSAALTWEPEALARIEKIPFFVRRFAKKKLEKAAIEKGMSVVTVALLEEIKRKEMP